MLLGEIDWGIDGLGGWEGYVLGSFLIAVTTDVEECILFRKLNTIVLGTLYLGLLLLYLYCTG